jgi:hypothetical protein
MKKAIKFIIPVIAVLLVATILLTTVFYEKIFWNSKGFIEKSQTADLTITIDEDEKGRVLEGFGASACWWSQIAGNGENAEEIAKPTGAGVIDGRTIPTVGNLNWFEADLSIG